jgi:hypothetical protein
MKYYLVVKARLDGKSTIYECRKNLNAYFLAQYHSEKELSDFVKRSEGSFCFVDEVNSDRRMAKLMLPRKEK